MERCKIEQSVWVMSKFNQLITKKFGANMYPDISLVRHLPLHKNHQGLIPSCNFVG